MITIFLNVNIHYLLHFQIDLHLIYFVVIIFPLKNNNNNKIKALVPMTVTTALCKAKTSRRRCITENEWTIWDFLFSFFFIYLHGTTA